jgi:hypothetical protein
MKFAYYTLMPARLTETEEMREQQGDIIQWDQSNGVYILTHDVSGVEWSKDRNLLPKNVYEVYVQYWKNVDLKFHDNQRNSIETPSQTKSDFGGT